MSVQREPAFPRACFEGEHITDQGSIGMSLRDWFAGLALEGMIAGSQGLEITREEFAAGAYALADAMLKERKK